MYEMIFSNIRDMYTSHSTQLSLFANESVVLKKLSAGGQMATTEQIDNYPGFEEGVDGME